MSAKIYLWNQRLYRRFLGCFLYFLFIGGRTSKMGLKFWAEISSLLKTTLLLCRTSVINWHSAQPSRATCSFDLTDASMSSAFSIVCSPFLLVTIKCSHFDQMVAPKTTVCASKLIILSLPVFYLSVKTIGRLKFLISFVKATLNNNSNCQIDCQKLSPVID